MRWTRTCCRTCWTEPLRCRGARWPGWLAALGLALAIIALAGPSLRQQERPLWQTRAPLVVALDLSDTILARDLAPSRLAQARALATLLRERAGGTGRRWWCSPRTPTPSRR